MKPYAIPCFFGALLVAAAAFAQDPVLVCMRAEDGSCVWVNQSQLPQADPTPVSPTPPHDEQALNRADMESEVWFDWAPSSLEQDPLLGKPGTCARTPGRARYRFAVAVQGGDINKIIEAYDWKGKSTSQADEIISKLQAIPQAGAWERSVVRGWIGEDPGDNVATHWRWTGDGQSLNFSMHEVEQCWFVAFGSDPETAEIVRRQNRQDVSPPPPAEQEPGVYEF